MAIRTSNTALCQRTLTLLSRSGGEFPVSSAEADSRPEGDRGRQRRWHIHTNAIVLGFLFFLSKRLMLGTHTPRWHWPRTRSSTKTVPSRLTTALSRGFTSAPRLTWENYLFADSDAGGERAASVYTILACSHLADVNLVEYLADVLYRLARHVRLRDIVTLMSARWGAVQTAEGPAATR